MKISHEQLVLMKAAYEYMYIIENALRQLLQVKMSEEYGVHWQFIVSRKYTNAITKKDFQKLNYHELVSCFNIFPELKKVFPSKFIPLLHRLTPIRNKIAHNHTLTYEELELLYNVYQSTKANSKSIAI